MDNGPKFVLCSSAGVTRPVWNEKKKLALGTHLLTHSLTHSYSLTYLLIYSCTYFLTLVEGCADIPIVRLNPLNILGVKREGEESLRETGVPYTIVRPWYSLTHSLTLSVTYSCAHLFTH